MSQLVGITPRSPQPSSIPALARTPKASFRHTSQGFHVESVSCLRVGFLPKLGMVSPCSGRWDD